MLNRMSLISRPWCRSGASSYAKYFCTQPQGSLAPESDNVYHIDIMDSLGRVYATGRRKSSVARVWVSEGSGQFIVNRMNVIDYFNPMQREHSIEPFTVTKTAGLFDVWCTVKGGGMSGQAGAVRLGISKALNLFSPSLKSPLKTAGMMTRDSRRVERKKPGQKKARKQYQWVKR